MRVLVVEDNGVLALLTREILHAVNVKTDLAVNGLEAISMACSGSYDVIVMDIDMPIASGLDATRRIREYESSHPEREPVPILAFTAGADQVNETNYTAAGFSSYLKKSCGAGELIERVRQLQRLSPHSD